MNFIDKAKSYFKKLNKKQILINAIVSLLIMALAIAMQYALVAMKVREENVLLVFTIAIIIILIETKNIVYGIASSIIFVLAFNFFNTEPYFTFKVNDPNYYITFAIFIIVSLIVGTLVLDLQKKNKAAVENAKKVQAMYDLSSRLLDNHDKTFIYSFVVNFFHKYLAYDISIRDVNLKTYGKEINSEDTDEMLKYALEKNITVGRDTFVYTKSNYLVFPIRSKKQKYAGLFIYVGDNSIPTDEIEFIKKNILHLVVVLDRELALKEQESIKVAIEKEKFKNSILRSLSHDLKTPLTSIKSGSDLILSSYDQIDDASKKEILTDIYNDACDLNVFIVNLLNMTKLDKNKKLLNRKKEPVDDILADVYQKIERNLADKTLEIKQSEELIFVYTDLTLLVQVIINLVDNAIKHTRPNTKIVIDYKKTDTGVEFNVIDNGGGINPKYMDKIFEDFYSLALKQDKKRSTGLGLSICRAIVEAHGGNIKAYNNDLGGATFTFNIPDEEDRDEQ